jgi:hypothetical protein
MILHQYWQLMQHKKQAVNHELQVHVSTRVGAVDGTQKQAVRHEPIGSC